MQSAIGPGRRNSLSPHFAMDISFAGNYRSEMRQMRQWIAPLVRIFAVIALVMAAGPAWAEKLSGTYYGVDDAVGASIEIKPSDGGFTGTFFDAQGRSQAFQAELVGKSAEAVLDMDGRAVLMRVEPMPFGANVAIVPFSQSGQLDIGAGRVLTFVRRGLTLPKPGPEYIDPPREGSGRIAANAFLASYEFWSPTDVRNGYLALPERFRTLMRMFAAVQLDVIWKLCLSPAPDQALSIALRGQGVSCKEVLDGIAGTQRTGKFTAYKADVAKQRETLRISVRCADRYPESKETCDRAARALSAQAVSLETAGTVLGRYR
jgi:hypothetical protein